jgi:hypothetical protein
MARTPDYRAREATATLAETLFYLSDPAKRHELEEFRIEYESVHGQTDLTKRYTSIWPAAQQAWLMKHDLKRYFEGLPPFAKAYLKGKIQAAAQDGNLDDMPDGYLRIFISKQMRLDCESPSR